MTSKKMYWKDIKQSFSSSKGRVISIASLMALGSFALVGLKVTGPDMRTTGERYLKAYNTTDLAVISDYGLTSSDQKRLEELKDKADIEYGYLKDVTIKGTTDAVRLLSNNQTISKFDVISGKLPSKTDEIALTADYKGRYKIGDTITFTEKPGMDGKDVLKGHTFKVVGFVASPELISNINLGASTAGTGELKAYGVVTPQAFDSSVYMVARIRYKDLKDLSPYSQTYLDKVYQDKKDVEKLLKGQAQVRLDSLKNEANRKIFDGELKIRDAKEQLLKGAEQLQAGQAQIQAGENQLTQGANQINEAKSQLQDGENQLAAGKITLDNSWDQLATARGQLDEGWSSLTAKEGELQAARQQLDTAWEMLADKKEELDKASQQISLAHHQIEEKSADLAQAKSTLDEAQSGIATMLDQLSSLQNLADLDESVKAQINQLSQAIAQAKEKYRVGQANYQVAQQELKKAQETLMSKEKEYQAGQENYQAQTETLKAKEDQYQEGLSSYQVALATLRDKESDYQAGLNQYNEGLATFETKAADLHAGQVQLAQAQATYLEKLAELKKAKETLAEKTNEYDSKKTKANDEIAKKEKELAEAKEQIEALGLPTYNVYTRREAPGSEGYISYENNSNIIDSVGNVFPIVLYFVAALVTFTTMSRFVDEERIKVGTFRALGYDKKDIMRKFVIYGLVTSLVGTTIGVLAGHILLPMIVYSTYGPNMSVPKIELHFYPMVTLLSILFALLSAVLPAYLVARKELDEKPAQLLLPKPPTSGSKILLERITPLWSRLSFTHKVTARNIFRYKQRMFMTIFGVCGSIALLFAGLGVRSSIADLNNRQFKEIIKYDMIVAKQTTLTSHQEKELDELLDSAAISQKMGLHYETVSKVAGSKNDEQSITLLSVADKDSQKLSDYITLEARKNHEKLNLTDKGAVISEKLAQLTNTKVGDTLTVQDRTGRDVKVTVTGITEMYMGHFIFMNDSYYQSAFLQAPSDNAYLIHLKDDSSRNTNKVSAQFLALSSVRGVVQNTILKEQVNTIVNSLNRVMFVMIGTSVLLAIVILYNLTNINVAERIRELSTIKVLGFYDKEVTLYIYRETISLSLIGILVGFILGLLLHAYMIAIIPPETVMFNPAVNWPIYVTPAVLVITILFLLGFVVNHWLKKVDMLEALKSVE